ncbi:peptidyl-tRNA hydrolase [compost metagenome]
MSGPKIAAQVAHVAENICYHHKGEPVYEEWRVNNHPKILLAGKEKDLLKLIEQGFYFIRDNGRTEIPANSLTVVGLPPMTRENALQYVKRLQLLKG